MAGARLAFGSGVGEGGILHAVLQEELAVLPQVLCSSGKFGGKSHCPPSGTKRLPFCSHTKPLPLQGVSGHSENGGGKASALVVTSPRGPALAGGRPPYLDSSAWKEHVSSRSTSRPCRLASKDRRHR